MRNGESNDMSLYRCCTTMEHAVQSTLTITRKIIPRAYDDDDDGDGIRADILSPARVGRDRISRWR